MTTAGCSFAWCAGTYWMIIGEPGVADLLLLALGAFLPSKTGMRVGSLLGTLIGAAIAVPAGYREKTMWPAGVVDGME